MIDSIPKITCINRNDIPNEQKIVNLEGMLRGLNAPYLECTLSHHNPPHFIAYQWRRKLPTTHFPTNHVLIVYENEV